MIKLDLKQKLVALDGKPLKEVDRELILGEVLSNLLLMNQGADNSDVLRLYELAKTIHGSDTYEIKGEEEYAFIEKYVKSTETMPLIKGQVLQMIQKAKNKS